MGITIIQKSDLTKKRSRSIKALILSGGAVTGGSFKAGGIKALNDYFSNFSVNDFDIYVGISSGSLIAAPLVGGISPESILKSLDGTSRHFTPLTAWHYYRPNFEEFILRPIKFLTKMAVMLPGKLLHLAARYPEWSSGMLRRIWCFVEKPSLQSYEDMMLPIIESMGEENFPSLAELMPSGIFDNSALERYIRKNIESNGLLNDFKEIERVQGKKLYISAMRLDGGGHVLFGPDEDSSLTLSEAIQASTALPGFYRPAKIRGVDYVDGGVQQTANLDVAVDKGAELIVCYNPFRPYQSREFVEDFSKGTGLASGGILAVLNQIFRALFHSRLHLAIDHLASRDDFKGDIILIEPRADDAAFFELNPLSLKNRVEAAKLGFRSVRNSIDARFDEISKIMRAHGIEMNREGVETEFEKMTGPNSDKAEIQMLLEGRRLRKRGEKLKAKIRRSTVRKRKDKKR
jgi:predicted acylesterase/phospholipase RssA